MVDQQFVRKAVSFNVNNAHQRDLYEWAMARSNGNFSAFVKSVLYAHKSANVIDARSDKRSDDKPE